MFAGHRVEAFGGSFHVPARGQYPCLYAWDSGYHALALRHFDRAAAVGELSTLYRANTVETGLLAHERPLPGEEARTRAVTSLFGPLYRPDGRSWIIDPPVPAYAAGRLYAGGDTSLLRHATAQLDAIERLRTPEGGGPPVILHPYEAGTDASPLFDSLVDARSAAAHGASRGYAVSLDAAGGELARAASSGHGFIVSDPTFCGWHLLALEELAKAWSRAGRRATASALNARATALAAAMHRTMWSEEFGLFIGYDHVNRRRLEVPTLSGVIAGASRSMRARGLGAKVAARLVAKENPFWGAAGVSFNPLNGGPIPRNLLWRGDVVWGATQYWAYLALSRNGARVAAARAREQLVQLIARQGFREYYNATSGEGMGAGSRGAGFTWPALVLEMT